MEPLRFLPGPEGAAMSPIVTDVIEVRREEQGVLLVTK